MREIVKKFPQRMDARMNEYPATVNVSPPHGHSPMYVMHKFFGRKQERLINHYIRTFTQDEGEIVLDPFCGSGVTLGETLRLKRKAIGVDINPISVFVTRNTLTFISGKKILEEFKAIENDLKNEISNLYKTTCSKCGKKVTAICFSWQDSNLYDKRYFCSQDGKRVEKTDFKDIEQYNGIRSYFENEFNNLNESSTYWFPKNPLYYSNGRAFLKKERYNHIHELFTKRNIASLALLLHRINQISPQDLRSSFLFAFSSMVHLASKMTPVRPTRPFSSSWIQPSYWYCPHNMESNVWELFERAIIGKQGLLKAKRDLNRKIQNIKKVNTFSELETSPNPTYFLINTDITRLTQIPENSVDYVITDPPYGHSIQYGELLYLWGSWLNVVNDYNETFQDEIIINHRQDKSISEYESLLKLALNKIYLTLKPDKFCTITFHSPNLTIRNLLYRSAIQTGFIFDELVFHAPARASAKSLLQPAGSQQGDFFFHFKKPLKKLKQVFQPITGEELEKWIVEIVKDIIVKEENPLPYNQIQNKLDPFLYEKLYKSKLLLNFNPKEVKKTLKKYIGIEFSLFENPDGKSKNDILWGLV